MKQNIGSIDRGVRTVVGLAIIAAGVYFSSWWGAIGVVLLAIAAVGWCPPYAVLGINTCGSKCEKPGDQAHHA